MNGSTLCGPEVRERTLSAERTCVPGPTIPYPSPRPSPLGRGRIAIRFLSRPAACYSQPLAGKARDVRRLFPLPEGEGQGEYMKARLRRLGIMAANTNPMESRMKEYIAFDSHKHYTLMEREDRQTARTVQLRVAHQPGAIRSCLRNCESGTDVAVEATGNWYWIVSEIEQAGLKPQLVHPRKAKLMMGLINKTDKLDVHGLNRLQRNGTLPTVWIPPAELRDQRELTRTR